MNSESVFNYFVGALALLSTFFSMLLYLRVSLPGPQMKVFDELLVETKSIYEKASAEGLLPAEMSLEAQNQLREYETQGDDLRAITYHTLSPFKILLSFLWGHSAKIVDLSSNLTQLRGELLTTSQKERARRRGGCRVQVNNESVVNPTSHLEVEQSSRQGDSDLLSDSESESHTAGESGTTSNLVESSAAMPRHFAFCICSLVQWLLDISVRGTSAAASAAAPGGDQRPSLVDVEANSRSSTVVDYPLPKDSTSAKRRPWSFFARWVRSNGRGIDEDVENRPVPFNAFSPRNISISRPTGA